MFIYIYIYIFLICEITVWYEKNNSIIMRTQRIIKRIIFVLFFYKKSNFKKIRKNIAHI